MEPARATGRMGMGKLAFTALATLPFAFWAAAAVAGEGIPFSAIRLRKPQTDRPEVWQATLGQFAKHRAGVDEVWFSTGICFPKMEEHRAAARRLASAAEDLRKLGILPSLQIQATIGHDAFTSALGVASGDRVVQLHRLADWASHGKAPVLVETPTRSFVQPRVRADGTLASVVFVNCSVGATPPVRLRLRGVAARKAVWSAFDAADVALDVAHDGSDAFVTLPSVPAWTGGYVFFDPAQTAK